MPSTRPEALLPKHPKEVLFVCTGNSCRSVMAEALFKKLIKEKKIHMRVGSCGTSAFAGIGASPDTILTLREEGIDVSSHRGCRINDRLVRGADIIFVMQKSHREYILNEYPNIASKVFVLSEFYTGEDKRDFDYGIPDPIGMGTEFYRNVKEVVQKSLEGVVTILSAGSKKK